MSAPKDLFGQDSAKNPEITPTVVNLRYAAYDVYIGRAGHGKDGFFGNPFEIGKDGSREEVMAKYETYARDRIKTDPEFRARVKALFGKVLGCFCKQPTREVACHGDILSELSAELNQAPELPQPILRPGQPRIAIYGPRDAAKTKFAKEQGIEIIDTTSHSTSLGRGLSPFLLGPVRLYRSFTALNVENAWQFVKTYQQHVDAAGNPTQAYWDWAKAGWANPRAIRYPMGKGAIPLYSLWNGDRLGYVEARKKIYIPLYGWAVRNTPGGKVAWNHLVGKRDRGEEIHLWDYDGYDYQALGITWQQALEDPTRKFGHSLVLASMLESGLGIA